MEVNTYYPFGLLHNYTATTQNAYQYKYNGKELQETGMYDYGARFYMPDIGRWGVVDPLAEKYQPMSTYHISGNNPIFYVDSNGMNYDDYGVDDNGNVSLIQKTDDNFDRLYKAKSDSNGNAVKDENGNAQKATEGVGKENQDYVKVDKSSPSDGTLISQLSGKDGNGLSHGTTTNSVDVRRVFQFAADNSRVEWTIGGFRTEKDDTFLVGTSHKLNRVTAPWNFGAEGLTYDNLFYAGHTHPFTRKAQEHDNYISKDGIYNFIYYTGAGSNMRENYFVPYWLEKDPKTGINRATTKSNAGQIKLPNLIPVAR
ncbi:RHS repeat-associated core domain-containing protein [Chryseobacterium sp.]|uniref:RHS repeat-associated core domain-containing protein n=1 Tax=Chryseobacterium sp. TaxID=1871047 RepID=UPI00345B8C17